MLLQNIKKNKTSMNKNILNAEKIISNKNQYK